MRTVFNRISVVGLAAAAVLIGTTAQASTAPLPSAAAPSHEPAAARTISLILDYHVAGSCTVYPNYPKDGVIGNSIGWTIDTSDTVAWRYNINSTWAMISDQKYRNSSTNPWWGIVQQSCIGTSIGGEAFPTPDSSYPAGVAIPSRILEGRSGLEADHYRTVVFQPSAATEVDPFHLVDTKGTLRDGANNFVIGNVFAGWHVHTTNQHDQGWTKVYVPNAKRWGWVLDIHL